MGERGGGGGGRWDSGKRPSILTFLTRHHGLAIMDSSRDFARVCAHTGSITDKDNIALLQHVSYLLGPLVQQFQPVLTGV